MNKALRAFWSASLVFPPLLFQPQETPAKKPEAAAGPRALFLWKIAGEKPSYLFGTIHVPDTRVSKIPPPVREILEESDAVYTEIPMDLGTLGKSANSFFLKEGQSLQDLLPKDLFRRLESYVESKGASIEAFQRSKIWAVTVQLVMLEVSKETADMAALDMNIYNFGAAKKKEIGGLETIEEQMAVFESFTLEEQRGLLEQTLDQFEEYAKKKENPLEVMLQAYLEASEAKLEKFFEESYDKEEPLGKKFIKLLLTDRNHRMAERIAKKIRDNSGKSYFFAVGAGHLLGKESVRELLEKDGFFLEKVPVGDEVPAGAKD